MTGSVRRSGRAPVEHVVIDRPERRNACDLAAWRELAGALREADADPDVRVVVLSGAGGTFCSGADLTGGPADHGHPLSTMRAIQETARVLHDMGTPTIAKVRGAAVGAGWNLALGCDLVAASTDARFSQIFVRRGLCPDLGGSWLLVHLLGMHRAKRLALTGDFLSATEALDWGLASWVVPDDELDELVDTEAARLAAAPPVAVAQTKGLLHHAASATMHEALEAEARAQTVNFATDDAGIAFAAFLAKEEPAFTGRWTDRP